MPKVTIGLPVYNGANYLSEAIESILAQTFTDFELIIADNASTDETESICRAFAQQDERIRYLRHPHNLGAAPNFNVVVAEANGRYFKWMAHDDLLAPEFLAATVAVLDAQPDVLLAFTEVQTIDENGRFIPNRHPQKLETIATITSDKRFGELIKNHGCFFIWGLMRHDILSKTQLIQSFVASDMSLLSELALLGRFIEVPRPLFLTREHGTRSVRAIPVHERASWFDPKLAGKRVFPYWRIYVEHFNNVQRVRLTAKERFRCYLHLVRWPLRDWNWASLIWDGLVAYFPVSAKLYWAFKSYRQKSLAS
ncbi:MAG: glycosyltransferase family 2 protein [Chloroflexota bacterium]